MAVLIKKFKCFTHLHRFLQRSRNLPFSLAVQTMSSCQLTVDRYPYIQRGKYGVITESDVRVFKEILPGAGAVLENLDEVNHYNKDWLGIYQGQSNLVLRPKNTEEVSQILSYCNAHNLAICTQGGNTGLVGGSVPVFDEVILSTQRMNDIISLDAVTGVLVCQAGCVLEALDNRCKESNLMMPLDLGAKGSCHIGGNLATNAGGIRLLRYGSLHGTVIGIEVVLANGQILDCLSQLRKDNTGYDLKHLFLGSEGTLGMITKVAILCAPLPNAINVAFMGCSHFSQVLSTLQLARSSLGEIISAFEFMDHDSMVCVNSKLNLANPIGEWPFYVLVETAGSDSKHDEEKVNRFAEKAMNEGLVNDGTMTNEPSKVQALWKLRELITAGLKADGHTYKYDISLPMEHYYKIVEVMREKLKGLTTRVVGYGHVGDGNLHFNATSPAYSEKVMAIIEPFLYDYVGSNRGSISAEHGLGFSKNKYIYHSKSKLAVELMITFKHMLDPKLILNPYKTLPMY